jgi:hypothetical protein
VIHGHQLVHGFAPDQSGSLRYIGLDCEGVGGWRLEQVMNAGLGEVETVGAAHQSEATLTEREEESYKINLFKGHSEL